LSIARILGAISDNCQQASMLEMAAEANATATDQNPVDEVL